MLLNYRFPVVSTENFFLTESEMGYTLMYTLFKLLVIILDFVVIVKRGK